MISEIARARVRGEGGGVKGSWMVLPFTWKIDLYIYDRNLTLK